MITNQHIHNNTPLNKNTTSHKLSKIRMVIVDENTLSENLEELIIFLLQQNISWAELKTL